MENIVNQQLELFNTHTPSHLYCSGDKMAQMIRIKRIALKFPYISVNPPKLKLWLPFDIDAEQIFSICQIDIPPLRDTVKKMIDEISKNTA